MENLLSITVFIPGIAAAILALFLRGEDQDAQRNAKVLALTASGMTLVASLFILIQFDTSVTEFQFLEDRRWVFGLRYRMGVDGISLLFVMLTSLLMPCVIMTSWTMTTRVKEYMIAFLVLETMVLGAVMALDLVLFYVFFEGALIAIFLIIGIWGGANRVVASFKYFLFTLSGSALMLIAIVFVAQDAGTTDMTTLLNWSFSTEAVTVAGINVLGGHQTLLWLAFFAAFAVKLPLWPFHTWVADAHGQASTAGSVVLAALVMKLGGYGFLRILLPMFPVGSDIMAPFVASLAMIAIFYAGCAALVQQDMKRLLSYFGIAHMGFVLLGLFALNQQGVEGGLFYLISHGVIMAALFICVGAMYDRKRSYEIEAYGGLIARMPVFSGMLLFFLLASIGAPGTAAFAGGVLTIFGVVMVNPWAAMSILVGIVLLTAAVFGIYRRLVLGDLIKESLKSVPDLSARERAILAPLALLTLGLGLYPAFVTDISGASVAALVGHVEASQALFAAAQSAAQN